MSQVAHLAGAYHGFLSMTHYSPPGWDADPSQGYSPEFNQAFLKIHLYTIYTPELT